MGSPELKVVKPLGSSNGTAAGGLLRTAMQEEMDRLIGEHEKGIARKRQLQEQAQALQAENTTLDAQLNGVIGGIMTIRKLMGDPVADAAAVPVQTEAAPDAETVAETAPATIAEAVAEAPVATA